MLYDRWKAGKNKDNLFDVDSVTLMPVWLARMMTGTTPKTIDDGGEEKKVDGADGEKPRDTIATFSGLDDSFYGDDGDGFDF